VCCAAAAAAAAAEQHISTCFNSYYYRVIIFCPTCALYALLVTADLWRACCDHQAWSTPQPRAGPQWYEYCAAAATWQQPDSSKVLPLQLLFGMLGLHAVAMAVLGIAAGRKVLQLVLAVP
jgi:hypothetical protein